MLKIKMKKYDYNNTSIPNCSSPSIYRYMVNCQIRDIYFRPQLLIKRKEKRSQNSNFLAGFILHRGEGKELS